MQRTHYYFIIMNILKYIKEIKSEEKNISSYRSRETIRRMLELLISKGADINDRDVRYQNVIIFF